MQWFGRTPFLILTCVVALAIAGMTQSPNDLPAAPSAVLHPKPAAPKSTPTPASQPASSTSSSAAPEPAATSSSADAKPANTASATKPVPADDVVEDSGTTFHVPVNEVSVVFTVTDKHNHYVKNLTSSDFKVSDDDHPVPKFRFNREKDLPLQVGLLIDASNSIRDRFKFEQESAIEFLNDTIRARFDKAFVVGFDTEAEVTQDFTDDTELLAKGVRNLRPGGGTAMYDALYYACRDKLLQSQQSTSVRRAIILVSDGDDNASHVTREEAIEMALRSNVIVYTISTNFPSGGDGDKVLRRIADATGGRAFEPFQLSQVADAFAQIQDDLRSQYALSYTPPDFAHDGRFRAIEISALRKGLKIHSRNGYYAPTN